MKTIVIIGIGNLGIRHLESIYNSGVDYKIYAIDVFPEIIRNAKVYIASSHKKRNENNIIFISKINQLPSEIDLAIIATNADVRLKVVSELLVYCKVHYLILEKVLFQRVEDYFICDKLLKKNNVKTYVNCPMRTYESYKNIKTAFGDSKIKHMTVTGGDWSVSCNGIHYIDLFFFFTGFIIEDYILEFNKQIKASKRSGFVEFTGSITGSHEGNQLRLLSLDQIMLSKHIHIYSENTGCVIDESGGKYVLYNSDGLRETFDFCMPYQSQLTAKVAKELFEAGVCNLPNYKQSQMMHIPLIKSLISYINQDIDDKCDYIAIT